MIIVFSTGRGTLIFDPTCFVFLAVDRNSSGDRGVLHAPFDVSTSGLKMGCPHRTTALSVDSWAVRRDDL